MDAQCIVIVIVMPHRHQSPPHQRDQQTQLRGNPCRCLCSVSVCQCPPTIIYPPSIHHPESVPFNHFWIESLKNPSQTSIFTLNLQSRQTVTSDSMMRGQR